MPKTYNQLYIDARKLLRDAGVDAYSLEARLIIAYAADKSPEKLMQDMLLYTSEEVEERINRLIERRLAGEPVAYICGKWEFYGLELRVTPDVLIPRSDTEVLVSTVLELMRNRDGVRFADLCTGSGCIGCALAHNMAGWKGMLLDKSESALAVAEENVRALGLDSRLSCVCADVCAPAPEMTGSFDLIVSNPPYISREELKTLDESVRCHEPIMALDGGEDGLDFYRGIIKNWKGLLRSSGYIVFEIGDTQAEDVTMLMRIADLRNIGCVKDSAGHDRVVYGRI